MTILDKSPADTDTAVARPEASQFEWEWRVIAVAATWTFPGVVAGVLVRLCIPDGGPAGWWLVGGGVAAAVAGGLLEAEYWP